MEKLESLTPSDLLAPYYKPTIGSIRFSLSKVSELVGAAPHHVTDDPQLRAQIDLAVEKTEDAARLQFQWTSHNRLEPMRRENVMNADNAADRAVSALFDAINLYRRMDPSLPLFQAADGLLKLLLPEGVSAITFLQFEDQHAATDMLLEQADGPGAAAVQMLNIGPFAEMLRDANRVYGEHLSSLDNTGVTYKQVQAAYRVALNEFFGVVLIAWSNNLATPETRNKVLAPIHEQNVRLRAHYRRKKAAPRVDPKTGEFSDASDDGPSEAELILDPSPAPAVDQSVDPMTETPAEDHA